MPAADAHSAQSTHNKAFAESLDESKFQDWIVTALFYSALHAVDKTLATVNVHPQSHTDRNAYVGRESRLKRVYVEYRSLETASRNARYNCWQRTKFDLPRYRRELETIRQTLGT